MCTLAKLLTLFNVVESFSIIKLQSWNCLRITFLVRQEVKISDTALFIMILKRMIFTWVFPNPLHANLVMCM